MAGDVLAAVETLDGAGRHSDIELTPDQRVRNRVIVTGYVDVVVELHAHRLPLGEDVGTGRQGAQRRPVELLETRASRPRTLTKRSRVEPSPGTTHPCRQHRHAVVAGEVVIARIQVRLVAIRPTDPRAQIVRDHQLRAPAEELESAHVRRRPVRQGLRPGRLGEGVVRCPEHGHEDLCLAHLTRLGVDHRHRLTRVVDEQLLAGSVLLAHHHVELPGPGPVLLAEPAVLQPLRVERLVLLPQQRQRHTLPPQLPVHLAPLRQRTRRAARRQCRKQSPFQPGVVDRLGYRPTQPGPLGTAQVIGHRRRRRPHAASNRPNAQRRGEVQPQHLSNLAHRQPPVRQCSSLLQKHEGSHSRQVVPRRSVPTRVIALDRNQ